MIREPAAPYYSRVAIREADLKPTFARIFSLSSLQLNVELFDGDGRHTRMVKTKWPPLHFTDDGQHGLKRISRLHGDDRSGLICGQPRQALYGYMQGTKGSVHVGALYFACGFCHGVFRHSFGPFRDVNRSRANTRQTV